MAHEQTGRSQAHSQTDEIKSYFVPSSNSDPLILIDTPGWGDTRGIAHDEMTKQNLSTFFKTQVFIFL